MIHPVHHLLQVCQPGIRVTTETLKHYFTFKRQSINLFISGWQMPLGEDQSLGISE